MRFFLDNCLSPRYAVALNAHTRILRHQELKQEWAQARLTAFFLGHGWMTVPYWTQVTFLIRWWPRILEQARLVERGTGFEVPYGAPRRFKPIIVRP